MPDERLRILVVDDSALVRQVLCAIIDAQPDMQAVGTAGDAAAARSRIVALAPDALTLDIQLPGMNGLDFLRELAGGPPLPVLIVATPTEAEVQVARQARALGACGVLPKPRLGVAQGLRDDGDAICQALRQAVQEARAARAAETARARSAAATVRADDGAAAGADRGPGPAAPPGRRAWRGERVIVAGASTGGTEALLQFLAQLPPHCPPVLVVQHMPAGFTRSFADRLDRHLPLRVAEACDGEPLRAGQALIAPGSHHLAVRRGEQGRLEAALLATSPVNRHRPSVDVLFDSAARLLGRRACGVLMTGMGRDGAAGLLALRRAGALTYAQDEASCVVFGMPREAIALGAAGRVLPLAQLGEALMQDLGDAGAAA